MKCQLLGYEADVEVPDSTVTLRDQTNGHVAVAKAPMKFVRDRFGGPSWELDIDKVAAAVDALKQQRVELTMRLAGWASLTDEDVEDLRWLADLHPAGVAERARRILKRHRLA